MKLAEALVLRASTQQKLNELRTRLMRSARIQEGDTAPENPQELLAEVDRSLADMRRLIQQINRTNAVTTLDNARTLTDALAERDMLTQERNILAALIEAAAPTGAAQRYSRSEVRFVSTVNVGDMQKRLDDLARRYRELDTAIQEKNWTVELIE